MRTLPDGIEHVPADAPVHGDYSVAPGGGHSNPDKREIFPGSDLGPGAPIPAGVSGAPATDRRSGEAARPDSRLLQGAFFVEPAPPLGESTGRDVFAGGGTEPDALRQAHTDRGGSR